MNLKMSFKIQSLANQTIKLVIEGCNHLFCCPTALLNSIKFNIQVYLPNQQEVFAYMWLPSILLLLEAMDPIMVMLPKRLDFLVQICQAIESSVCNVLGSEGTLLVDKQKVILIFSEDSSDNIVHILYI